MGTRTREYIACHGNFDRLATAVRSSVGSVAIKAFTKNLIGQESKSFAENGFHSEDNRASKLLGEILDRVEQNTDHFYTFATILLSIPNLKSTAEELIDKADTERGRRIRIRSQFSPVDSPSGSNGTTAAPPDSTGTHQPPPHEAASTPEPPDATLPTHSDVFEMLIPLASQWQNIGVLLKPPLPQGCLDTIKQDNNNQSISCLRVMLEEWLNQTGPPTPSWAALVSVVKLFNPKTAQEMATKFGVPVQK